MTVRRLRSNEGGRRRGKEGLYTADSAICQAYFDTSRMITFSQDVGDLPRGQFATSLIGFQYDVHRETWVKLRLSWNGHDEKRCSCQLHIETDRKLEVTDKRIPV